jgi:hypothetical protein
VSRVITAGESTFTPRKETYSVLLAREELAEREDELRDRVNGLAIRITHAEQAMQGLADEDGPFRQDALEGLQRELKGLRAEYRAASSELFVFRLEVIAQRLDPTPDVQVLLDHWDDGDYERALEVLDERPTSGTPMGAPGS